MAKPRASRPGSRGRPTPGTGDDRTAPSARGDDGGRTGRSAADGDDLTVAVRVRPGAGRTRVGGRYDGPHGPALIVAVGAPAVDGKATEAVRRALAEALGVRPAAVSLKLGATSRDKVFIVVGDVGRRVTDLRDGPG